MAENKVDPKEIEKVQKLLSDEEFVKKLISQDTIEDAKKLFEEQGITTSIEEMKTLGRFIKKISEKGNEKLSDDDLGNITGGLIKGSATSQGVLTGGLAGMGTGAAIGGALGAVVGGIALAVASNYSDNELSKAFSNLGFEAVTVSAWIGAGIASTLGGVAGAIAGGVKGYKSEEKWFNKRILKKGR